MVFVFSIPHKGGRVRQLTDNFTQFFVFDILEESCSFRQVLRSCRAYTGLNTFLCSVEGYIMKYYTCSKHPLGALDTPNLFAFRRKKQILMHILILLDFFILCQNQRLFLTLGKDEPRRWRLKFW